MTQNYDMMIQEKAERVFSVMEKRVSEQEEGHIQGSFELAKMAHVGQRCKPGEQYFLNPFAVANGELQIFISHNSAIEGIGEVRRV